MSFQILRGSGWEEKHCPKTKGLGKLWFLLVFWILNTYNKFSISLCSAGQVSLLKKIRCLLHSSGFQPFCLGDLFLTQSYSKIHFGWDFSFCKEWAYLTPIWGLHFSLSFCVGKMSYHKIIKEMIEIHLKFLVG